MTRAWSTNCSRHNIVAFTPMSGCQDEQNALKNSAGLSIHPKADGVWHWQSAAVGGEPTAIACNEGQSQSRPDAFTESLQSPFSFRVSVPVSSPWVEACAGLSTSTSHSSLVDEGMYGAGKYGVKGKACMWGSVSPFRSFALSWCKMSCLGGKHGQ